MITTIDQVRHPSLPSLFVDHPFHQILHRWTVAKFRTKAVYLAHAGILEDGAVLPQLVNSFLGVMGNQRKTSQQVIQRTIKRLGDGLRERQQPLMQNSDPVVDILLADS